MKPLTDRYRDEIDRFFEEVDPTYDRSKGHVWIAGQNRVAQALTVEPPEGGQYEIAVRFQLHIDEMLTCDLYAGYMARDGYMVGRNTGGH